MGLSCVLSWEYGEFFRVIPNMSVGAETNVQDLMDILGDGGFEILARRLADEADQSEGHESLQRVCGGDKPSTQSP